MSETPIHSVDPSFSEPGRVAELRQQAREALDEAGRKRIQTIIAIPSNPDIVAAAILGFEPDRVIALNTGGPCNDCAAALRDWSNSSDWPGDRAPKINNPWQHEALSLPAVFSALKAKALQPDQTAYLITGGTSEATPILDRLAHATGALSLHAEVRYDGTGPIPETILLRLLAEPVDIVVERRLRQCRRLVKERAFSAASEALDEANDVCGAAPDLRIGLHRAWVETWRLRDAMLFDDAQRRCKRLGDDIDRCLAGGQKVPGLKAMREVASQQSKVCEDLASCQRTTGRWASKPRLPLVAEALVRADQERDAGRLNHAALLYYRVIEACLDERLRVDWGIRAEQEVDDEADRWPTRRPAGAEDIDPEMMKANIRECLDRSRIPGSLDLRERLSLFGRLVLLVALRDPLLQGMDSKKLPSEVKRLATLRNRSILAHGYEPVDMGTLDELRGLIVSDDTGSGLIDLVTGGQRGALPRALVQHRRPHLSDDGLSSQR